MKMDDTWEGLLEPPIKGRNSKPRSSGVTMLIDKGLSLNETRELLTLNALFIDFIKLTFGTTALYPIDILRQKICLTNEFEANIYPGGTFFELAYWQAKTIPYFNKLKELGFKWVEISDGTLEIPLTERIGAIRGALTIGLAVISEVGKKDPGKQPDETSLHEAISRDLNEGAAWVIVEGRESGRGIGIFDGQGRILTAKLNQISEGLNLSKIIWEAPLKEQQAKLINDFGPNVNLGNIPPSEIMALEAMRRGYRNDTWKIG
jgi:phosphosulfolactate synthase